jgi:hypothetical protein
VCGSLGAPIQGCVGPTNALPKTLCVTVSGPSTGTDDGSPVTLNWVSGDGSYCDGFPILYSSGCLGPNGAGAHCLFTRSCEILGQETTVGVFVPYGSHEVTVTLSCGGGRTTGTLEYTNYWNEDCNPVDPCPKVCTDGTTCPPPGDIYCPTSQICYTQDPITGDPVETVSDSYLTYPMSLSFPLFVPSQDGFFACSNYMPWVNLPCAVGGPCWASNCGNTYDSSFGEVASCMVSTCGDDSLPSPGPGRWRQPNLVERGQFQSAPDGEVGGDKAGVEDLPMIIRPYLVVEEKPAVLSNKRLTWFRPHVKTLLEPI